MHALFESFIFFLLIPQIFVQPFRQSGRLNMHIKDDESRKINVLNGSFWLSDLVYEERFHLKQNLDGEGGASSRFYTFTTALENV